MNFHESLIVNENLIFNTFEEAKKYQNNQNEQS
jgi:hypothetical protein